LPRGEKKGRKSCDVRKKGNTPRKLFQEYSPPTKKEKLFFHDKGKKNKRSGVGPQEEKDTHVPQNEKKEVGAI